MLTGHAFDTLTAIASVLAVLYLLQMGGFGLATWRSRYRFDRASRPTVTVLVAARNEEDKIADCLRSLVALRYPSLLLQIIVIDDQSCDGTARIVRRFARRHPHLRLLTARPSRDHLRGKASALAQGIEASTGEILLITDADCQVQPGWVEETVKYYADPTVGVVAGFVRLSGDGWFARLQALDWYGELSTAAAAMRLGFLITAVGCNLSVRRAAYDAIGGYRKLPFSLIEDYILVRGIVSRTKYRARYPLDAGTIVTSLPCGSAIELHRQRKRWFLGARQMHRSNFVLYLVPYAFHAVLVACAAVGAASGHVPWWPLLGKVVADFLLIAPALREARAFSALTALLPFELGFSLYILFYPLETMLGRSVVWKDRVFSPCDAGAQASPSRPGLLSSSE